MILGETSLHVRGPMGKVILAAAAYLVAVAVLSRGPLGAIRVLGPRLHQALDLVLVGALVASPLIVVLILGRSDLDTAGIIVAEALAVVLLRMAFRTRYVPAPVPAVAAAGTKAAPVEAEPPPPAPASAVSEDPPREAKPQRAPRPVPSTAWTLGVLAARARRRGAGSDRALGGGARRLGTALGRANRRRSG